MDRREQEQPQATFQGLDTFIRVVPSVHNGQTPDPKPPDPYRRFYSPEFLQCRVAQLERRVQLMDADREFGKGSSLLDPRETWSCPAGIVGQDPKQTKCSTQVSVPTHQKSDLSTSSSSPRESRSRMRTSVRPPSPSPSPQPTISEGSPSSPNSLDSRRYLTYRNPSSSRSGSQSPRSDASTQSGDYGGSTESSSTDPSLSPPPLSQSQSSASSHEASQHEGSTGSESEEGLYQESQYGSSFSSRSTNWADYEPDYGQETP